MFLNMQYQSLYMYIHCMCVLKGFFACKHSKFPEDKMKSASFLLFIRLCNRWAFSYVTHLFYNNISRPASHQDYFKSRWLCVLVLRQTLIFRLSCFYFNRVSSSKNGTIRHSSNSDERPLFQIESDRYCKSNEYNVAVMLIAEKLKK